MDLAKVLKLAVQNGQSEKKFRCTIFKARPYHKFTSLINLYLCSFMEWPSA